MPKQMMVALELEAAADWPYAHYRYCGPLHVPLYTGEYAPS